jgi:hypothetical protein
LAGGEIEHRNKIWGKIYEELQDTQNDLAFPGYGFGLQLDSGRVAGPRSGFSGAL